MSAAPERAVFKASIDTQALALLMDDVSRRQLPFAVATALNNTAFAVRNEWKAEIGRVFDRPTPLTMNAALYKKATKQKLVAEVFIRDEAFKGTAPVKYFAHQVEGGPRSMKRSERWLQHKRLLQPNQRWVAGRGAKLNQYGNIRPGQITQILSQLGAQALDPMQNQTPVSKARRKRGRRRGGEYFAITRQRGRLRPGVYERVEFGFGSAVRSILYFTEGAQYRPTLKTEELTSRLFAREFPVQFDKALARALATARR